MPGGSRSLPSQPSLRYLRLEAKRRLATGEFSNLHDAQVAIAREHGLPSWAALKQYVSAPAGEAGRDEAGPALAQLRWVISRFKDAGDPGWAAPGEDELRQHFIDQFLAVLPPAALVAQIASAAGDLRGELAVLGQGPLEAQVRLADVEYLVVVEPEPPHRIAGLHAMPLGRRVRDPRVTAPAPVRTLGEVPAGVEAAAGEAFAESGLAALLLAGGTPGSKDPWVLAKGWADLDRGQILDPGSRFPAPGVTVLVTATAVLRLVADGRAGLDDPANDHLRTVRLADDTVTVRDLLAHTGGVDNPAEVYAGAIADLATLMGPVIGCSGPRGVARPSNGGVAVLGQLIADVTRTSYADAASALILEPLGLRDSTFPASTAGIDPAAVTGYALTLEGMFQPVPDRICTIQAAGGLWSTGADLVRLGLGWSRLLPESLAHEALTPQPQQSGELEGPATGLGWLLSPRGDLAVHAGAGPDATATLGLRIRDHRVHVVLTSRMIPVDPIEARLLRAWTNALTTTGRGPHVPALPDRRPDAGRPGQDLGARRLAGRPDRGDLPLAAQLDRVLQGHRALMIEVDRLVKRFGAVTAVDGLSFTVRPGHVTGFLGPNGAGKSTTMRVILGLDAPTSGTALVNQRRYDALVRPLREVGALLDATALHGGRTARAHITSIARSNGIGRRRVTEVLQLTGLESVAGRRVAGFSLGMKQRLGLAVALLGDPPVLMFDEPVNGLDTEGIAWIRQLFKTLAADGRTVLVSSHLMSEMAQTADHLIIIGRGRLLADTTTANLIESSARHDVLVRSPRAGELAALLTARGATVATGDDGALAVTGLDAPAIGDLAAEHGLAVHALIPRSASLEDAYLDLTGESVEYRAAAPEGVPSR